MGSLFGGGTSTATTTPAPPTANELALQAEALITSQIRNQLLREQIEAQGGFFAGLESQLEGGIGATLAEEDRFGILAGETLGRTPGAAPGVITEGQFAPQPVGAPPLSAQIGAPGAGGATAATAEVTRLQAALSAAEQQFPDQFIPSPPGSLLRQGEEDSGPIPARTIVNPQVAQLRTQLEAARKDAAVQTAVQSALAAQPGQDIPQDLIDRLEALLATPVPPSDGTPAGEGIRQQLFQKQLDLIEQGGRATEQDIADIARAADAASTAGAESVSNFADRLLVDIRDVLTPARGLRPQDTPIRDAGGRVGAEAVRQFGELETQLRSVQAQTELTLPLARQGFQAELTGFQQNLAQAARAFQVGLRQQAFDDRLRLAATRSAAFANLLGVPFAGGSALQAAAAARGGTTTSTSPGNVAGGIGGLLLGIGSILNPVG